MELDDARLKTTLGVQDVLARYAHLVDNRDLEAWASLFTEDAVFRFGEVECRGRKEIHRWMAERPSSGAGCHNITNISVETEGADRASATSNWILSRRSEEGQPWQIAAIGTYRDSLVRRDGRWLISEHDISAR